MKLSEYISLLAQYAQQGHGQDDIRTVPAVVNADLWVSVWERLPTKEDGKVFIKASSIIKHSSVQVLVKDKYNEIFVTCYVLPTKVDNIGFLQKGIVSWQPLPEV